MKKSAKLHTGKKSAKNGRLTSSHRGLAKLPQSPKRAKNSFFIENFKQKPHFYVDIKIHFFEAGSEGGN